MKYALVILVAAAVGCSGSGVGSPMRTDLNKILTVSLPGDPESCGGAGCLVLQSRAEGPLELLIKVRNRDNNTHDTVKVVLNDDKPVELGVDQLKWTFRPNDEIWIGKLSKGTAELDTNFDEMRFVTYKADSGLTGINQLYTVGL